MKKKSLFFIFIFLITLTVVGKIYFPIVNGQGGVHKLVFRESYLQECESGATHNGKVEISSFTTYFDNTVTNRTYNIKVATEKLNNTTISVGDKLSFNKVVGKRTAENGYKIANVIIGGKYVKGYGGGVCQVSTTLFNAWAVAGLEVDKVQCHSLPTNYAELSRDATVSEYIDLVLVNSSASEVDISAKVVENSVVIKLYGAKSKYKYHIFTEKLKVIEPQILPDIEVITDDIGDSEYEVNNGACGYLTRAIIEVLDGERVICRRELRRDYYRPIDIQRIHKIKSPFPPKP